MYVNLFLNLPMSDAPKPQVEDFNIVLGMTGEYARNGLKNLFPDYWYEIVKPDQSVDKDLDRTRVRLHVDKFNVVRWITINL